MIACPYFGVEKQSKFALDRNEHRPPIIPLRLPKQTHRRIPRAVVTIEPPAPIRHMLESKPRRSTEGAGQMCDRGVACDDQVEVLHHGRSIDKCVGSAVEFITQRFDVTLRRQTTELIQSVVLLEADQSNSGQAG